MSSGNSDSVDFWPGFVDALSNVILVLVFVVVIFAFSLYLAFIKITDAAVQKGLDSKDIGNAEVLNASKQVTDVEEALKQVQKLQAEQNQSQNDPKKTEQIQQQLSQAQQALGKAVQAQLDQSQSQEQKLEALQQSLQQTQAQLKQARQEVQKQKQLQQTATDTAQNEIVQKDISATSKVQTQKEKTDKDIEKVKVAQASGGRIEIEFAPGVLTLDEQTLQILRTQINPLLSGVKSLEIQTFWGAYTYSEGRRIAFYQSASVRNYLLDQGVDKAVINSKIAEQSSVGLGRRGLVVLLVNR